MKYVSLDLETTGLSPISDQILQVSFVIEDTNNMKPINELPSFTAYLRHDRYSGTGFAISLNSWIFDILSQRTQCIHNYPIYNKEDELWEDVASFLYTHLGHPKPKYIVAGKNVAGFDMRFLPDSISKLFSHKVIDPATLYVNFLSDETMPSLSVCKERSNLNKDVAHDAYEDAIDVIKVLRNKY